MRPALAVAVRNRPGPETSGRFTSSTQGTALQSSIRRFSHPLGMPWVLLSREFTSGIATNSLFNTL